MLRVRQLMFIVLVAVGMEVACAAGAIGAVRGELGTEEGAVWPYVEVRGTYHLKYLRV